MTDIDLSDRGIKLAMHAISWNIPRGDDVPRWLDEVVEAGYDGVSMFTMQTDDYLDDPDALRAMLGERGLALAAVTGFVSDTAEEAERTLRFMHHFGARHLACTDFDPTLTVDRAVGILDERAATGDELGINVYYHNHTNGVGETMTQLETLMSRLEPAHAHLMLDVGHATKDFPELPPAERAADFLERHWSDIEFLELKDWNEETDLNTPLGEGYADLDRIMRLIDEHGYPGGWLNIEQNGNMGPSRGRAPIETARVSRAALAAYGL
jgi:sugar phosphate isomerase/epimerase